MQNIPHRVSQQLYIFEQLSGIEQELFKRAVAVRGNAQASYSKFHVGAALITQEGNIYTGCNVERCTLTQTTHAEQNAIDTMIAIQGASKIQVLVFVAASADKHIALPPELVTNTDQKAAPCGHCLQIIWENCYGDPDVKIMTLLSGGHIYTSSIGQLLPVCFGPRDLGIEYQTYLKGK